MGEKSTKLKTITIEKPDDVNLILVQGNFIKTIKDLHERLLSEVPGIRFGLAFCEAADPFVVQTGGTDADLIVMAERSARTLCVSEALVVFLRSVYPVNIMKAVRTIQEVGVIYCASPSPVEVMVAETKNGRGVMGVLYSQQSKRPKRMRA